MREALEKAKARFDELTSQLSDPAVVSVTKIRPTGRRFGNTLHLNRQIALMPMERIS